MIKGIGTDIISIKRVQGVVDRQGERFLNQTFTEKERAHCDKHKESTRNYAGRFAAKEAVVKAIGTGFGTISFQDIEILNDENGKPYLVPSENLLKILDGYDMHISISHCEEYATAMAVWGN